MGIDSFTDDFVVEWNGKNININGANINFDGRYGTQCMDLWNYWWTELGLADIPRHVDAAGVWEDTSGAHYNFFDGILPSKPAHKGDVFIYNRAAWGTGYGHIGIVISDNGDSITVLETNGLGDGYEDKWMNQYGSPPRIHTWAKTNLYGYLRPIVSVIPLLQVPDAPAPMPVPAPTGYVPDPHWEVDPGDTLTGIAAYYGLDVHTLAIYNGIYDANQIKVGEWIWPCKGRDTWKVDPGDTLSKIAMVYGISVDALCNTNGINDPNSISVGQRLNIP